MSENRNVDFLTAQNIGLKLRAYRQKNKMTLLQVSEAIGKSKSAISNWELGRSSPGPDEFVLLLALYGIENVGEIYGAPDAPMDELTFNERRLINLWRKLDDVSKEAWLILLENIIKI